MKLAATYRSKDGTRCFGRDVTYFEPHPNLLFRLIGRQGPKRTKIEMELISEETALSIVRRLLQEEGFFILETSDGRSSVDFADSGDQNEFFIEQYFDSIYGGIYSQGVSEHIVRAIFAGCTSEELRDLFPTLDGDLVYEYKNEG
jgi:hypothetical protein